MTTSTVKQAQQAVTQFNALVDKLTRRARLDDGPPRRGPKGYLQRQLVALLVLKARSGLSYRDFITWLFESRWPDWLALRCVPCKSTVHAHFVRIGLSVLRWLNRLAVEALEVVALAIDSTGLDSVASKHYERRIKRKYKPFLKLSIVIDTGTKVIVDWISQRKLRHDVIHAYRLLWRTPYWGVLIYADKAYDCNDLMRYCRWRGNLLYCPIRKMSIYPEGYERALQYERYEDDEYHKRNCVEGVMYLLKRRGLRIRATKTRNQHKEVAWHILNYNLERLAKAQALLHIIQKLWTTPTTI